MTNPDPAPWIKAAIEAAFQRGTIPQQEPRNDEDFKVEMAAIIAKHYKRHSRMQHGLPPLEKPPLGPAPDYAKPQQQSAGGRKCKSCGAAIIWITDQKGTRLLVNKTRVRVYTTWGHYKEVRHTDEPLLYHISHFLTCPNATKHSKHNA